MRGLCHHSLGHTSCTLKQDRLIKVVKVAWCKGLYHDAVPSKLRPTL